MIGILSDAHGNKPAFDHAIEVLRARGAETFIFLGDAVGYLPGTGVLDSIAALGRDIRCVRGNHESMLLHGQSDPEREGIYRLGEIRQRMSRAELEGIAAWPVSLSLETEAGKILCVHGSPADPTYGYVYPDTDLGGFRVAERFVFMGNTHRPFIRESSGTTFVNAGSCGMPRDHGAFGSSVLFDEERGEIRLIRFDIREQTRQALGGARDVHPSVLSLFLREAQTFEGELIG